MGYKTYETFKDDWINHRIAHNFTNQKLANMYKVAKSTIYVWKNKIKQERENKENDLGRNNKELNERTTQEKNRSGTREIDRRRTTNSNKNKEQANREETNTYQFRLE